MRLRRFLVLLITCHLAPTTPAHAFPHGTVVFTLAVRDGLVMAADGLTIFKVGDPAAPSFKHPAAAEPKIAVCGQRFLCGMAGINPFPENKFNIKYHFQNWISAISSNHRTSPRQFSKAIQDKARRTFRNIGSILKTDPYWKSEAGPPFLLVFQVAGYNREIPQVCKVLIPVDRKHSNLAYPEPTCETPTWRLPSPTSFMLYVLSLGHSLEEAVRAGTPESRYFLEIQSGATATAKALLPNAPPALQAIVGNAAGFVSVTDKFNPDQAGGVTTIGVVRKGELPSVSQFPD